LGGSVTSSRNRGDGAGGWLGLHLRWRSAWLGAEEQGRAARVPRLGACYKGARDSSPRRARHARRGGGGGQARVRHGHGRSWPMGFSGPDWAGAGAGRWGYGSGLRARPGRIGLDFLIFRNHF
jgi:hypothetical protein